jgi:preprotein translocase subunit YajC
MKSLLSLLVLSLFSGSLFAAEGAAAGAPNPLGQGLMIGVFILVFYFLIWRPQNKRAKEHRQLVSSLEKGDEVVITGGILGKITQIADDFILLNIAEGVEIKVQRQAVAASLPKGTLKTIA